MKRIDSFLRARPPSSCAVSRCQQGLSLNTRQNHPAPPQSLPVYFAPPRSSLSPRRLTHLSRYLSSSSIAARLVLWFSRFLAILGREEGKEGERKSRGRAEEEERKKRDGRSASAPAAARRLARLVEGTAGCVASGSSCSRRWGSRLRTLLVSKAMFFFSVCSSVRVVRSA